MKVFYTTNEERQALIDAAEARKETMLHDDFEVGPNGENRLTFGDVPEPVISPRPVDRLALIETRLTALESK